MVSLTKKSFIAAAVAANTIQQSAAFLPTHQITRHNKPHVASSSLQMCICIHCKHVTNCAAYHFVEKQHSQPHMNKDPTWQPREGNPTIQLNIRESEDSKNEWKKFWEEHDDEQRKAEEAYARENNGEQAPEGTALFGETKYDLTGGTTYEFDVVACEDFLEEKDAWVKNMPEEVRIANPDFVPT
jgi:hypothetical protein